MLPRMGILTESDNIARLDSRYSIVQYDESCNCIREAEASRGESTSTDQAELLQVALAPPYPPLFEYANGEVEQITVDGNELHLSGWTELRKQDVEQQFLLITPTRAQQTRLTTAKIDTANPPMQRYGFDLRLSYPDETTAAQIRPHLCLLTRSMLTPVGLIRNTHANGCSEFIRNHR